MILNSGSVFLSFFSKVTSNEIRLSVFFCFYTVQNSVRHISWFFLTRLEVSIQ